MVENFLFIVPTGLSVYFFKYFCSLIWCHSKSS